MLCSYYITVYLSHRLYNQSIIHFPFLLDPSLLTISILLSSARYLSAVGLDMPSCIAIESDATEGLSLIISSSFSILSRFLTAICDSLDFIPSFIPSILPFSGFIPSFIPSFLPLGRFIPSFIPSFSP